MALWQYYMVSWIDMYNEFIGNAAKITEHWSNLLWTPWSLRQQQQSKDKVRIE